MSYFKECSTAKGFTNEQYRRMRMSLEHGNRQHLVTGQQTWAPPPPSAVSWEPGRLDVLAVSGDANLYHKHWASEMDALSGWGCLGGYVTGAKAVAWGPNHLDIFARGADGEVLHKSWDTKTGWLPSIDSWTSASQLIHY